VVQEKPEEADTRDICADSECGTVLSRYNKYIYCNSCMREVVDSNMGEIMKSGTSIDGFKNRYRRPEHEYITIRERQRLPADYTMHPRGTKRIVH
jgi:hypothetical protein